jgi:hypothetical protein
MVMQNRHDGTGSSDWWNDLPPAVRMRISAPPELTSRRNDPSVDLTTGNENRSHTPGLLRDLSRLAFLFLVVALANLVFLLIALSFLSGSGALSG